MGARLVHIAGGRRLSVTPLSDGDLLVGRDPTACTVVIESARVSRQHLLVRSSNEGWIATDLGSANGTTLNGGPLAEPTVLAPGDVLELAGEARFAFELSEGVYEGTQVVRGGVLDAPIEGEEGEEDEQEGEGETSGARVLAIGLGAAFLILAAVVLWRIIVPDDDLVYAEATQIAAEGLQAAEKREWTLSRKKLNAAARVLYTNDRLADVPREQVMQVAMERLGARLSDELDREVDLPNIYRNAIDATVFTPVVTTPNTTDAAPKVACRLDDEPPERLRDCVRERVDLFLVALRQSPDGVPSWFYDAVGRRLYIHHDFFQRSFRRGEQFVPMMKDELRRAKMPELLHYLSLIESGYITTPESHAGAVGLWQFMPATAREYGLRVDSRLDERTDPRRSTQKAAEYLNDLAQEFGAKDLMLVLAGYNKGENGVRKELRKGDDPFEDRSYWHLVEKNRLPQETAEYVAKFVAAGVAGEGGLPSEETLEAAGFKSP